MRLNEADSFWTVWIGLWIEKKRYNLILRNQSCLLHRNASVMLCLVYQRLGNLLPTAIFLYLVVWHTEGNLLGLLAELVIYQRLFRPDLSGREISRLQSVIH